MSVTTRMPVKPDDVLVALDTCVLRDLGYAEPPWFTTFVEMARAGVKFSFLDNVPAEIVLSLQEARLDFDKFRLARERAAQFVFAKLPVLPGGTDLRWAIGATDVEPADGVSPFDQGSALWTNLNTSSSLNEMETPFISGRLGAEFEMSIALPRDVAAMFDTARDRWISNIMRFDELEPDSLVKIRDDLLEEMRKDLDTGRPVPPPPLSVRTDLLLNYRVRIGELRNKVEDKRLNPESEKRRNDAIDVTMLGALMLPALLCLESKFYKSLKLLPSFQANWVYDAASLAGAWTRGEVRAPSWPAQAEARGT